MNILVTGGAGYIGSGLLVRLGKEFPDATITSLDNLEGGNYRYVNYLRKERRYRLLVSDIRKKSDVQKAVTKDTAIIMHLAAIPGVKTCRDQPKKAIETNIYGTHLLLEEAVNCNVERFIFTSSAAVYGTPQQQPITEEHPLNPINLYGVTKVSGEKLVNACHANSGLTTTILRFSNVYGLGAYTRWKTVVPRFVWQATNDQPLTIRADGKQQRNFVHVQDIIDAFIQCSKASKQAVAGETFNLGGEALSVNSVAEIVIQEGEQRLGKEISTVFVPLEPGEVYTSEFNYSSKRASRRIGYKRKRGVRQGVSELFDFALKVKATAGS
ncbi:MAG: NAD-dependent epimerase/dehydratase family protein [Candidatus Bathyarchaeota archaeon]|nr:NAD-dependent epimerase/dehydratase family protein [Candidatus Bathyarchaeota archaeon]